MALRSICEYGFPSRNCRCTKVHMPYDVEACPAGHIHRGFPMDEYGQPLKVAADKKLCPRCEEFAPLKSFRGDLCGFCSDFLERWEATK